jgi:hypothetical protein
MSSGSMTVGVTAGSLTRSFATSGSSYAWTSRLAGQTLQPFFDGDLVTAFDMDNQGAVIQANLSAGDNLSIAVNGSAATAYSLAMTNPFGFADFQTTSGTVRVARAVAVVETMNDAQNQQAIVRTRQDGTDTLAVMFYRVDDYAGTIGTLQPGDPGYAAAAQARAYQLSDSTATLSNNQTLLNSPGNGLYAQALLNGVNGGDIVAMELFNNTHNTQFWAFAQANELVNGQGVGHLWNYANNVWGWEDTLGGGDRDYNDLVVGYDFTSTAGHGILK